MTNWLRKQSQIPFSMYAQPSEKMASPFNDNAKSGFILQQFYQAVRNADTAEEHQKAIPMSVISELGKKTISELSTAIFEVAGLRIFFACRSCECLKVSAAEQQ